MARLPIRLLILAIAAAVVAAPAGALELQLSYDRAFSPNGDGSQDTCPITVTARGGETVVDSVYAAIYSTADIPPVPADLLVVLADSSAAGAMATTFTIVCGWNGDDQYEAPLADGFYYLHAFARAGADTLWQDPAIQLEISTAGPTFHSVAMEPTPWFTPTAAGADTILQLFFTSEDFDTLTDTATARLERRDPADGTWDEVALVGRDAGYYQFTGGVPRMRLLWDGRDGEDAIVDGLYRARLRLEDDAGNPADTTLVNLDLDTAAPVLSVLDFGGAAGGTTFWFHPDSLPDTLLVRATDRQAVDSCRVAWEAGGEFDSLALRLPGAAPDSTDFAVPLVPRPAAWVGDSTLVDGTYRIRLDARDEAGLWTRDHGSVLGLTVRVDGVAPPAPVWTTATTTYIQQVAQLAGTCAEAGIDAILYEDGVERQTVAVSPSGVFSAYVTLSEGTHDWTARGVDATGNLSPPSAALSVTYRPRPALVIPGRLRGRPGETIQINTAEDAASVTLRVYTLTGGLVRVIDAAGGPREFAADWDLRDDGGRELLDGLYVVNVRIDPVQGEARYERKVVAIVRD
ncbi:MAG: hypothetical protein JW819_11820 [Candidatus Krumholzibacteriota bacterium]|nr:hypothetical protein [Candidatus Krumholzibacteriota bacterium]